MQKLPRLSDGFLVVALAGCVGTTAVAVGNGYLPWLGPPSLRFARPVIPPAIPLLPPLQMTNPVIPRSGPEEPILPLSADTPGPAESFTMPDFLGLPAPMEGVVPGQEVAGGARPSRSLLTPDNILVLLRASGTNAGSSTVVLPAFIPPAQTRAPSSSSSYRSAPVPR